MISKIPMIIFLGVLSWIFSKYTVAIYNFIYVAVDYLWESPPAFIATIVWFVLTVLSIYAIVIEIDELFDNKKSGGVLLALTHGTLLAVQYLFMFLILSHKGMIHGWQLHIIEEKFYIVLIVFSALNVLLYLYNRNVKISNNIKENKNGIQ